MNKKYFIPFAIALALAACASAPPGNQGSATSGFSDIALEASAGIFCALDSKTRAQELDNLNRHTAPHRVKVSCASDYLPPTPTLTFNFKALKNTALHLAVKRFCAQPKAARENELDALWRKTAPDKLLIECVELPADTPVPGS